METAQQFKDMLFGCIFLDERIRALMLVMSLVACMHACEKKMFLILPKLGSF